ncbi:SMC-Scp complex subunit ScpB [Salimicrobium halophilum]|uniref:Segregation and condensation protein B n=1 Tax=Salimicrobium halophilum TaxID=86666 RepID=A0A1G8PXY0_9BACI|nr:SMC-Scp complex subunit ScpB [Salimicrobium halophilum]SDI97331.1 segregation and condensation protein B [Salimicrobium halophilum]
MKDNQIAILEGLLFAAGGSGMTKEQLAKVLEVTEASIDEIMDEWKEELGRPERGLRLMESKGVYRLTTKPRFAAIYKQWLYQQKNTRLSQASLETLAIIAYKQPITRVEIDDIRGVKSDQSVQTLVGRGLIEDAGRKETIGRPILYATTEEFLIYFGLESLDQLPVLEEAWEDDLTQAETFFDNL